HHTLSATFVERFVGGLRSTKWMALSPFLRTLGPRAILAHRLNCFRPRFRSQYERTAFVTERCAHLIGQILLILVGKQLFTIDKQQKSRRRDFHLRCIKKLEPVAVGTDWLPALDRVLERAVQ